MIPLRDQELLRQRFQRDLASRVRVDYFTQKQTSLFVAGRQECPLCEEVQILVEEVASLSDRIALSVHDLAEAEPLARSLGVDKVPAIVLRGQANRPVRYFGMPSGGQFVVFIETLLEAAAGTPRLQPESVRTLRRLKTDVHVRVLVTPACLHSPAVAQAALRFALQNVRVKTDVVELAEFPALAQRFDVRLTPTTLIGDRFALPGSMTEAALLQNLMRIAEGRPFSGETRVGQATPFNPAGSQQQAQPRPIGSSGLVLPR